MRDYRTREVPRPSQIGYGKPFAWWGKIYWWGKRGNLRSVRRAEKKRGRRQKGP